MGESKNPCSSSDQEKKNMFVKIGGVSGGGGIGAVILLGGALATAALASAFIVGKKERKSGKSRRPRHQNPPPDPEFPSNEATKEDLDIIIKSEKDTTQSLILDEKPGIEINGGTPENVIDVEKNDSVLDGFVIINDGFQLPDEKFSKDMILTEEDFTNEISKESDDFNQVYIDKEMVEGEVEAVEIIETKTRNEGNDVEVLESEVTLVDEAVEEHIDQMEVEKSPKMEEKSEEIELVHSNDNGEIDEVKYEVAMEENELDSGIEVAVVDNAVEGVDIGQTEAEKEVCIEVKIEEKELEGCGNEDKEISGVEIGEIIEETTIDVAKFGIGLSEVETSGNQESFVSDSLSQNGQETHLPVVSGNQETISKDVTLSETVIVSESYSEDGQITTLLPPVFDSFSIEHEENVNGALKEVALPIEIVEVIQEEEVVKQIEEHLVKEHINEPDEEIREEVGSKGGEDNQSFVPSEMQVEVNGEKTETLSENKEENVSTDENNPTPERIQLGDYDTNAQTLAIPRPKEELISVGIATNDEVPEILCQQKNHDVEKEIGEIKDSSETIEIDNATRTDDVIMETSEDEVKGEEDYDNEADLSDEVEETSVETGDSSLESNSEAVRPAMEAQQVKLIEQEVIGKIQEDKTVEKENGIFSKEQTKAATEANFKKSTENPTINVVDSKRESQKKYMMEMALPMNSTRWRMVIATLSVLSSLSCSWFFGLSFMKLCLIVFFTMVLSKIHGY